MPYIGREPQLGAFQKLDDLTAQFDSAQTVFTLTVANNTVVPGSPQNLIISVGGALQEPGAAYSVNASTITFASAPANTQPFFGVLLGDVLDVGQVTPNTALYPSTVTASGDATFSANVTVLGTLQVGNSTITINSSTLQVGNGAAGTPSVTFTGDANTGLWSPGADLLAISTGGTERFRVGAAGQLLVAGAAGTSGQVLTSGGSNAAPSWTTISTGPTVLSKTASYTVQTSDGSDVVVLCTNTITITLYAASGNSGKVVTVKNNGTGTITIDGNASETIDGALTQTITAQYTSLSLLCDGTGWAIF